MIHSHHLLRLLTAVLPLLVFIDISPAAFAQGVTGVNSISGENLVLGAGTNEFGYITASGGIALGTTGTIANGAQFVSVPVGTSGVNIATTPSLLGILNIYSSGSAGINGSLSVSGATFLGSLAVSGTSSLTGNVGIGTAPSTTYALDVNGTVMATDYFHVSDMRLKTDVRPIDHALDKILSLKGVTFKWKKDGRHDIGVIAQNVATVFPDIIAKSNDGTMAVEYGNLIGPMIEAIRELKNENDELRSELADVKQSLKAAQTP
jgi:hypothetical protein